MPIDAMHKELLIRMSLFLGNKDHGQLGCTAKPFKNLDIEKALCSESVTIDHSLLMKIRRYHDEIKETTAKANTSTIKELIIAFKVSEHLTNNDLVKLAKLGFIHEKTETINLKNYNQITDLKPLEKCSALKNLDLLWCTQITDLSPLASCTALTSLDLYY